MRAITLSRSVKSLDRFLARPLVALFAAGLLIAGLSAEGQAIGTSVPTSPNATSDSFTWVDSLNPAGTLYHAQAATDEAFSSTAASSDTYNLSAVFSGLSANATYYFRVSAEYAGVSAYTSTVSAVTHIETPSSVTFAEVSTGSLIVSAEASFTKLGTGLSAVELAKDGSYGSWGAGDTWAIKGAHPNFQGLAAAESGGKIYLFGGLTYIGFYEEDPENPGMPMWVYNTATYNTTVTEFDPVTGAYTARTAMPTGRAYAAAAAANGKIYVMGGYNGGNLSANEEYDPAANTWATRTAMPTARRELAAAVVDGNIYAMGGFSGAYSAKNEKYYPNSNTWSAGTDMPTARTNLGAAAINGKIYAIGGNSGGDLAVNEEYDPASHSWSDRAPMPAAGSGLGAAVSGGKVYVMGANHPNNNLEYDPAADAWTVRAYLNFSDEYSWAAVTVNRAIYLFLAYSDDIVDGGSYSQFAALYMPPGTQSFGGLTPNTQYSFKAKARNSAGVETAESPAVSTYTLAVAPTAAATPISSVSSFSVTANWQANGNPGGTAYRAQISAYSDFSSVLATASVSDLSTTFSGLRGFTAYYFRVAALHHDGTATAYATLGSTVTLEAPTPAPTSVYFDEVSSAAIVASAYAQEGFGNLQTGQAGAVVAKGGVYAAWRSGNIWTSKAAMPTAREQSAAGVVSGKLYVIGGINTGTKYANNEEYDPVSNSWTAKANIPTARYNFAIAEISGKLYAVGGYNSGYKNTNEEYDPVANTWSTKAVMPTPREKLSAVALNGKLYAMGGAGTSTLNVNEEYYPVTDTWTAKAVMTTARYLFTAGAINGKIYTAGGYSTTYTNTTEAYDPGTNSWSTKAGMPTARYALSGGVIGGKLYAAGGAGDGIKSTTEEYDPANDTWNTKAAMPEVRYNFAAGVIGGKLYAAGGMIGAGMSVTNTALEYDPGVAHSFASLTPNTQYVFKAKARDSAGVETAESPVVSTYTLAFAPTAAAEPVSGVFLSSLTVSWADAVNPAGTLYRAQLSTLAAFSLITAASDTYNKSALFEGLDYGTTYYARVTGVNGNGIITDYLSLGSTRTFAYMAAPTSVYFDEISSASIVASAYTAEGFFGLQTLQAGALVAKNGTYADWRNGNTWTSKATMPTARRLLAAGAVNGKLYALGGDGVGSKTENEEYDPASNSWSVKTPMPTPRTGLAVAGIGGKLYAVGGYEAYSRDTNEAYDPVTNTWSTKASMPTPRYWLSAAPVNGKLYAIGGMTTTVVLSANEEYDPVADSWAVKTPMPSARYLLAAGVIDGRLYALGGQGSTLYFQANEAYDPQSDAWTVKAAMPTGRYCLTAGVMGGKLYAIGGWTGAVSSKNEEYDPVANLWTEKAALPPGNYDFASGVVNGRLYAVGGWNGAGISVTNTNWEYDPGVSHVFSGLTPNTLYNFKAKARDALGAETGESAEISTYTLAAVPAVPAEPFSGVTLSTLTANWSDDANPAGTLYRVQLSSLAAFSLITASSDTYNKSALFAGLEYGTVYYARVAAISAAGLVTDYQSLGSISTLTDMTTPTSVYFDEVSSASIVASAYAPAAFEDLDVDLAGVVVAKNGVYADWRSGNAWTAKEAMTAARGGAAAAAVNGKLYLVGGGPWEGELTTNEEYDPASNAWTAKASMSIARSQLAAVGLSGKVYAIGGVGNWSIYAETEEYDPETNAWTLKASMPTGRDAHSGEAVNGKIYVAGGYNGSSPDAMNYEYDAAADTWTTKAGMPYVRYGHTAAAVDGKVYILGGTGDSAGGWADNLSTMYAYDPGTDAWTEKTSLPAGRYGSAAAAAGGKLYAIGGHDGGDPAAYLATNEEYDPSADAWTAKASMPTARHSAYAAAIDGKLYVIGGSNGANLTTNEMYDPGVAHQFAGLTPNTQYTFKAKARSAAGIETAESPVVSTYTLAAVPGAPAFTEISSFSLTASWAANNNPAGTTYIAEISSNSFATAVASQTIATGAAFSSLAVNSAYAIRVKAVNSGGIHTGYSAVSSTYTAIEAPTSVYLDEVGTTTIVASAYAAAFTNIGSGSAGAVVAKDGAYADWRGGNNAWSAKAALPTARPNAAVGVIGGKMYVAGGGVVWDTWSLASAVNEEYDPVADAWTAKTPMPEARGQLAAGVIDGKLYAVGDANEAYDPVSNTWETKAAIPGARSQFAIASADGKLYAIGGIIGVELNENLEYNPVTDAWTAKTPMTKARRALAAGTINGKIYAVGGYGNRDGGGYETLPYTEEYDPATDSWTTKAEMNQARENYAAAVIGGKLYAVGGQQGTDKDYNEEFDPIANTWTMKAALTAPRAYLSAGVLNGKLYAVGGAAGGGAGSEGTALTLNEMYDPGTAQAFTGLTPNTQYAFKAKARSSGGTETAESPAVSTYTLAATPVADAISDVSTRTIRGNWAANGNPAGTLYTAELSTDAFVTLVDSAATTELFASFYALTPDTAYSLRVKARNGAGTYTAYTSLGSTVTLAAEPVADGLAVGSTYISGFWTENGNPSGTTYIAELSSNGFTNYDSNYGVSLFATFTPLIPNTAYELRVKAMNSAGTRTAYASLGSTVTLAAAPSSAAVSGVGETSLLANWTANGNPAGTVYIAELSTDAFVTAASSQTTGLSAGFASLTANTTYYLRVKALNSAGTPTDYTALGSTITLASGLLAAEVSGLGATGLTANWTANGNPAGTVYTAELSADGFSSAVSSQTAGLSAAFGSLTPNTVYALRVKAVNSAGTYTGYTSLGSTTTLAALPAAAAISGVGETAVTANWTANANPAGTVYIAELSADAFATVTSSQTVGVTATFNSLIANTAYALRVKAVNSADTHTGYTTLGSTLTLTVAPLASAITEVGVNGLTANWTANSNPAGTVYLAQVSAASNFSPVTASSQTIALNAVFSGLTANSTYYLRAQAFNASGGSAYADLGSTPTLSAVPASTALLSVSSYAVSIDWAPNGNPEPGTVYQVWRDVDNSFSQPVYALVSTTTYTAEGLAASTAYYFKVRAINHAGTYSGFDSAISTTTYPPPPGQAAAPVGTALGISSVSWTWTALAGASSYNIYPATDTAAAIGASVTSAFIQEGLTPNATYSVMTAGVNISGTGQLSAAGTPVWTPANPPTGAAASAVYATSATVVWALNGNPALTAARVERSTDNAAFAEVYAGGLLAYTDPDLLGCSTYYYRVRNLGGNGSYTDYNAAPQFRTQGSTPAAPGNFSAESLDGNLIALTWEHSPYEGVTEYRVYYDSGTGTIDYATPLAVLSSTVTAYTTAVLTSSPTYKFGLRAKNRCGLEDGNTSLLAAAGSINSLTGVRAAIKIPQTGKKVDGNRVTVMAELTLGDVFQTAQVRFQYKASTDAAWTDIPAASANHPNPDTTFPYMMHWDVSNLFGTNYDLRAVATDTQSAPDTAPGAVTVSVDSLDPDINENNAGGSSVTKDQKINNAVDNTLQAAAEGSAQTTRIFILAGSLSASTVTVTVTNNPASAPAAPDDVMTTGVITQITLSNGQTNFSGGLTAAITLGFADEDGDGIVDGTTVRADTLVMYSAETLAGPWRREFGSTVDLANKTVTGNTPHFSFFALFSPSAADLSGVRVYPVPFVPNDALTDNGVPYSSSDGNSGIIFDTLPASVKIKIYTLTGQLVDEISSANSSGKMQWDARNDGGKDVASGGYMAVISSPGNKTVIKKILVVR